MTDRRCGNCEFAAGPTGEPAFGYECHLNPPAVWRKDPALQHWPRVRPDDWCGRFRPRDRGYIPAGERTDAPVRVSLRIV